ncbi:MAG TPA: FAD/NAD(P)-binding protein [Thermoplasmata archaeon]|nr:FAD/NAD(P)-binding protein [Thermoplasmata archaeon]
MASDVRPSPPASSPHPLAPSPYVVRSQTTETGDTRTLVLSPADGGPVRPALPGQFNMVYVFGVGEAAISLSGDPSDSATVVHTVRDAGRITAAIAQATPGQTLGLRGPYGHGWPLEHAKGRDVVLIAGGLGLPPLRPVLYELLAHRAEYGRIEVIYGARSPKDLVYYDQIQQWRHRSDLRFQVTVDAADREWYGDVGLVTTRIPDTRVEAGNTVAFLCGPEIMMRFAARDLEARGISRASIWLSMERNMKCAVAVCGHCQFGPAFVCREGPVFRYDVVRDWLATREL